MVTNDGATILKAIALDNAAAKVLVNISKVQDDEVGDGTTSVTVLAAELLREAEKLVDKKIHPQTIIEGYRIASHAALTALEKSAVNHSHNQEAFKKDLLAIARTTLSSKVLSQDRNHFAELACDAVLRLKGSSDLSHIQIIKKAGGKLDDSYLDEGFILDKKIGVNQPKRLEKAKILIANTAMDTDKIKIFGARVSVGSTGKLAELEKAEREKMKAKVEKIKAHGINCFINRQLIYNWPEQLFSDAGIMSIEHADFDGIERLALVTGGEIASTFDHPDQVKLGHCDLIEEVIIGEDTLIKFSGVAAGQACTIVLRGATEQLLDEAERSLHDALAVLSQTVREPRTTLGGGCAEMIMARAVDNAAMKIDGKKQIAVSSFAIALRQLPTILADNAGYDSSDLVAKLRTAINDGMMTYGLDLMTPGGGIADMREIGVIESYKLKRAVVSSASEAAEVSSLTATIGYKANLLQLLLRVDNIIRSAPRKRERH
jgi:T-complex protein 1 subunit beta